MRKPIMSEKNFKIVMIAFVGWIVLALAFVLVSSSAKPSTLIANLMPYVIFYFREIYYGY